MTITKCAVHEVWKLGGGRTNREVQLTLSRFCIQSIIRWADMPAIVVSCAGYNSCNIPQIDGLVPHLRFSTLYQKKITNRTNFFIFSLFRKWNSFADNITLSSSFTSSNSSDCDGSNACTVHSQQSGIHCSNISLRHIRIGYGLHLQAVRSALCSFRCCFSDFLCGNEWIGWLHGWGLRWKRWSARKMWSRWKREAEKVLINL